MTTNVEPTTSLGTSSSHPAIISKELPTKESSSNQSSSFLGGFLSSLLSWNTSSGGKKHPVAKGVYAVLVGAMSSDSQKTLVTEASGASSVTSGGTPTGDDVWLPATSEDHNKGVPVVVRRPQHESYDEPDDHVLLKKLMTKARKLPQTSGKFASPHIMINAERTRKMVPPLMRDRHLDQIAREHAEVMAEAKKVIHMDGPLFLQTRLLEGKDDRFFARVGVNIARGNTVEEIHKFMMANLAERNNIQDKRFSTMGVGTARADDGTIYLCQVFGG